MTCISALLALLHNKIAEKIKEHQNHLTDDEIFENARLVTIYVYQNYHDQFVLPAVLGTEYSNYQEITSTESCYDPKLDPTPLVEFSAAAGRYFHTYLPNDFSYLYADYTVKSVEDLSRDYGGPAMGLLELDSCFRGMIHQHISITGHSFLAQNSLSKYDHKYGVDLFSLDVQRSRDTCIKSYIFYIKKFYAVDIKCWEDLSQFIPLEAIQQLKLIYSDVCDLELYAGISVEKKYNDGLLGPVARKIVTEQYLHSRCADSKHYTNALDAGM